MKSGLFLLSAVMALIAVLSAGNIPRHPRGVILPEESATPVVGDTSETLFYDDFFDGTLLDLWLGDTASFEPVNGMLGLVEQVRSPAFIAIPSTRLRNTTWEIGVATEGVFSSVNYIRLYLSATTPSFQEAQWGYHLQIDGNEADYVCRLWRQNGLTRTSIFESVAMPVQPAGFNARIRVTCTQDGHWKIAVDEDGNGLFRTLVSKSGETLVKDDTYDTALYSGYFVSFSPTRWNDFKLDYVLIKQLDHQVWPEPSDIPDAGDILINEVLTNPRPGGADFLEIYNNSNKTIDLSRISVARVNTNGTVGVKQPIANHPSFIYPSEYKVLTRQPAVVKQHYPNAKEQTFIEMAAFPNFNNETGGVVIYSQKGVIDSLFYTAAMQSPFMVSNQGISLERQHFSLPTNATGSFRSAATATGGATPGYQNSQYIHEQVEDQVSLATNTFSPDDDGFEDRLAINYRLPESGYMTNIDIYTDQGRLVKRLARNQSLGTAGTIYWDGLSDGNVRLPIGMYIAVVEVYNAQGERKIYRKGFVLATRL